MSYLIVIADYVVLEQYADAQSIYELSRERKMTIKEKIVDFVVLPGLNYTQDHWRDPSKYYLVYQNADLFLVNITGDFFNDSCSSDLPL